MSNQSFIQGNYKLEIDGLRALAVIAVIITHFNKDILPSGYLGVDIFFVISGYVITSSLATRASKNFWDFLVGFYARRIKRLVPALVFYVLITSILICNFVIDPQFSLRTGIASLFGMSNLYLLKHSTDYFATQTTLNIFNNTWSLGVEEQFYFIFPFLIWSSGFGRQTTNGTRNLFILTSFLTILSLIFFVYLYANNQPAAYFLMPTRFWEMSTGCILFLVMQKKYDFLIGFKKISSFLLLLAIFLIMLAPISRAVSSTISIVALSSLLIFSLKKGTPTFKFLTNKKIVHIGALSYSLYLWHWSVLSISRWTIGVHWWSIPFQIGLIYSLSVASYRWIETPLRRKDWSLKKWKVIFQGILSIITSGIVLLVFEKQLRTVLFLGKQSKSEIKAPYFNTYKIPTNFCHFDNKTTYSKDSIFSKCLLKVESNNQTIFFIGDSHSQHFWLGAELISQKTNSNFFTFSGGGNLFPSIKYFRKGLDKKNFLQSHQIFKLIEKEIKLITKANDLVIINLRLPYHFGVDWYDLPASEFRFFDKKSKVVYRNSKKEHFEEWLIALKEFTSFLEEKNVKVIISTPTPEFPFVQSNQCKEQNPQWFNRLSRKECSFSLEFFTSKQGKYFNIIERLKQTSSESKNLYLFNSLEILCPNSKCSYTKNGEVLYSDADHISNYNAKYILAPAMIKFLEAKKILTTN